MDIENDLRESKISSEVSNVSVNQSERELLHLTASAQEEAELNKEDLSRSGDSNRPVDQDFDGSEMGQKNREINSSAAVVGHVVVKESAKVKKDSLLQSIFSPVISIFSPKKGSDKSDLVLPDDPQKEVQLQHLGSARDEVEESPSLEIEHPSADTSDFEEPKPALVPISDSSDSITEAKGSTEEAQTTEVIEELQITINDDREEPSETPVTPVQEYQRAISGAITVEPGAASNTRRWWELNNFAAGESTRDIEADFVKSDTFVVAGMSIRGASHQEKGAPNQDAFSITFARDYLVAVVSDGVSSAKHSGYGSRYMSTKVSRGIAIELDKQTSELGESDVQRIISSAISESAKSLMNWTADSFESPDAIADQVKSEQMAATLTVAVIPNKTNSQNQREMTLAFIGDSPCYILAEDTWNIMTPATKEGLIVENSTSWVPGAVVGEVDVQFLNAKVTNTDVILLMTDGVSTSLGDGSYPVARFLGPRLAKPQNMGDYFDSLNFDRRGEADDRTLVAIYSQISISGSNS
jgi:serine/threonine protein phosphatase PrpC